MPNASETNDIDVANLDVDTILDGLCAEFKYRNGRDATEEELKQWKEQLSEAIAEGALGDSDE